MAGNSEGGTIEVKSIGESPPNASLPPAYVSELQLENVHCFSERQALRLGDEEGRPRQWTLILGNNGTGKTTLLRCLAAMEPRVFSTGEESRILPRAFMAIGNPGAELLPAWLTTPRTEAGDLDLTLKIAYGDISPWARDSGDTTQQFSELSYTLHSRASGRARAVATTHALEPQNGGRLLFFGYGATRRMGSTSLSDSYAEDATAGLFSDDIPLLNAEEWLLQADYTDMRTSGSRRKRGKYEQVRELLLRLLPDVSDVRISTSKDRRKTSAEFKTPSGWVPLTGLGLGYRTVIAWIVDLASRLFDRYPNSKNPLAEAAVVLIDEIDLHLHPKWQRTIMRYLSDRFPGTQFIATAHSPLVVQSARDANLVLLARSDEGVVIKNDPAVVENWRVDQILTSVFELSTARPPEIEPLLQARETLLAKPHLSEDDERELRRLNREIGSLPTAESPDDIAAMDIIRRAARALELR